MSRNLIQFAKAGFLAVAMAVAGASLPALAAGGDGGGGGGGGSGGGGGGSSDAAPIECKTGWTYDAAKKVCVRNQALNDEQLYRQGRVLALAGHYASALDTLNAVRNKDDAMVLTMIGYSTRKLGKLEEGIAIYHKALAIDPRNVNTREYLGEGYLDAGRIDLAEAELDTLKALCGVGCEQYQDLAKAIAGDGKWH
jgi:tetratricopeptide (TPR) repeat protein